MKTVERHFELDAGHRLAKHDFKCQNLHGHRYKFDIRLTGEVDEETGLLMDFSHIKKPIMEAFDHNLLLNSEDPILKVYEEERKDIWKDILERNQKKEVYIMNAEPTVENIADEAAVLIFDEMTRDERERIAKIGIQVHETPNCKTESTYEIKSFGQKEHNLYPMGELDQEHLQRVVYPDE